MNNQIDKIAAGKIVKTAFDVGKTVVEMVSASIEGGSDAAWGVACDRFDEFEEEFFDELDRNVEGFFGGMEAIGDFFTNLFS